MVGTKRKIYIFPYNVSSVDTSYNLVTIEKLYIECGRALPFRGVILEKKNTLEIGFGT